MKEKIIIAILATGILFLAVFFRLYGVNWDQNQHLHPDERFLTMVAGGISWPEDLFEYLDTSISPLNPHNRGFGFFVYGTFPVFFTKWVAEGLKKGDYGNLTLVGRQLSALFDLGTVILVFLIAREIIAESVKRKAESRAREIKFLHASRFTLHAFPLLSMFFYSIMVLPIQLSHFYAVETYLTFFITLSFYLLIKIINSKFILNSKFIILNSLLGISFGLALASKITALLFLPIIGLGFLAWLIKNRNISLFIVYCLLFIVASYFTIRLSQPYLFTNPNIFDITLNQKALDNWKQLKLLARPDAAFPPAVQWIKTKPYLFPLKNMVLWGLGLPLGIISLITIIYYLLLTTYYLFKRKISLILNLSLLWILLLFTYEGMQFAKTMRYFYPIYPFLAIISGLFVCQCINALKHRFKIIGLVGFGIIGLLVIIYPLAFISIYSHQHTRVTASEWVYKNIPPGSSISGEHWDDFVPMSLPTPGFIHEKYKPVEFPLYGEDTKDKWRLMDKKLQETDYIILTSNRLYGAIMTVPEKYPITYKYYEKLFNGSLGFIKVAEFTSRPNIPIPFMKTCLTPPFAKYGFIAQKSQECPLPGISFVDDYADEMFTVYDHPKVIVFKKVKPVDYLDMLYH